LGRGEDSKAVDLTKKKISSCQARTCEREGNVGGMKEMAELILKKGGGASIMAIPPGALELIEDPKGKMRSNDSAGKKFRGEEATTTKGGKREF